MSFLFRPHRELLSESMDDVAELEMASLIIRIVDQFGAGAVEVKPYGYDSRINWETYIVLHNGRAVGFTDGES